MYEKRSAGGRNPTIAPALYNRISSCEVRGKNDPVALQHTKSLFEKVQRRQTKLVEPREKAMF